MLPFPDETESLDSDMSMPAGVTDAKVKRIGAATFDLTSRFK